MTTESNLGEQAHGVRTFSGRTLEELLPQIRAELGADAIILREREGLAGGVGGFFAQRVIEVDARRADSRSTEIYDDSAEDDLRPRPQNIGPTPPPARQERPTALPRTPRAPETDTPETDVFLELLRQAASDLLDDPESLVIPAPEAATPTDGAERRPDPEPAPQPQRAARQRPTADPAISSWAEVPRQPPAGTPQASDLGAIDKPAQPIDALLGAVPEPSSPAVVPRAPAPPVPRAPAPLAPHFPAPVTPAGSEHVRQRPSSLRTNLPTGDEFAATFGAEPSRIGAGTPFTPPLSIAPKRPESRLRSVISRLFGGRRQSRLPRPAPPRPLDIVAATRIAQEMSSRGASQAWSAQLISTAGAHGSPLADSLQAAAEAEVARRIVASPALPATGAAVAFIGSGGAGKTRCTAALASAYRRASTLGVTVVALDNPDGARELHRLLGGEHVPVLSLSGDRAASAIAEARKGGFVVVDTPTATPTDPDAIQALGNALEPLELDATYVALPATLGSQAARRVLAGFGKLHPTAVTITHADQTDQLAVAVEIAVLHRIPLAYIHSGTDHRNAMSAVDAPVLARQLMS